MCLTIRVNAPSKDAARKKVKPQIAEKDIVVYKVLRDNNESPYQNFKYKKGTEYYRYGPRKFGRTINNRSYNEYEVQIEEGLHSYREEGIAIIKVVGWWNRKVVKMIVPKGSQYYISSCETEIVSDRLIWY
jgi:hypothetical protein